MLRCLVAAAAALGVAACGPRETGNYYKSPVAYTAPSPAQNFSAVYYQSHGGLGRNSPPPDGGSDVGALGVPYPDSCGHSRTWNGGRCVRALGGT